jgi:Glyoxalase-like domain
VATRLYSVVFDAADHRALAEWWSEAVGWPVAVSDDEEAAIALPPGAALSWLVFVPVDDPKVGKNRVHLDLASSSAEEQRAIVDRLVASGARRVDIGQADVPWVVLADPEGNELCVLEPRAEYAGRGPLAAVVVDAADPAALERFWEAAAGPAPQLEFVPVPDPKVAKNRVHLDVAPFADDDHRTEVDRLIALGARLADVGQGPDVSWVVLTDPEGNEFCVLSPR